MSITLAIAAPVVALVAGYLMRADEVAHGRAPHLPFLYVEDGNHEDDKASKGT